jgi:aminoglycoside phosphotransferase (APT) family kinase protein
MEAGEYSQRLGVITPEQLQAALGRHSLGKLVSAAPATQGLFGQNIFLTTTEGEFVLRGAPHYKRQLEKEAFFARLIHDRTDLPAPWPFMVDTAEDIFGWEFALMPRLPGLQVRDRAVRAALGEADKLAIAAALGRGLAMLHTPSWPSHGEYDFEARDLRPHAGSFRGHIVESVRAFYDRCREASDATTEDDFAWCDMVLEENAAALDEPFEARIVHHDYKEGNTVFERQGGGWRVGGVFDLMECYIGDPEEDLARPMFDHPPGTPERTRAFIRAYRSAADLRAGYRERFKVYMLRDCLLMWQFGQRNGGWFPPGQRFRPWAEPYVLANTFD